MTYAELKEAIEAYITATTPLLIITLMSPEAAQLVMTCNPTVLKPEEQLNTKSMPYTDGYYQSLLTGMALVSDADEAMQWYNSTFTNAGMLGVLFETIPDYQNEIERTFIIAQEKIFDACS